jgi:hypothetical protein
MYYSSLPTYEMLGRKDPPNTYGDLSRDELEPVLLVLLVVLGK